MSFLVSNHLKNYHGFSGAPQERKQGTLYCKNIFPTCLLEIWMKLFNLVKSPTMAFRRVSQHFPQTTREQHWHSISMRTLKSVLWQLPQLGGALDVAMYSHCAWFLLLSWLGLCNVLEELEPGFLYNQRVHPRLHLFIFVPFARI